VGTAECGRDGCGDSGVQHVVGGCGSAACCAFGEPSGGQHDTEACDAEAGCS